MQTAWRPHPCGCRPTQGRAQRPNDRYPVYRLLACALILISVVSPLRVDAQVPFSVTPSSDLTFGTVLPGIPTAVPSTDATRAGTFEIRGESNASVRIEMILPPAMISASAAQIPLAFGPNDGSASSNRGQGNRILFDPWQPLITVLGRNGRLYVRIGGTAQPASAQAPGSYSAIISLTVYNLGT